MAKSTDSLLRRFLGAIGFNFTDAGKVWKVSPQQVAKIGKNPKGLKVWHLEELAKATKTDMPTLAQTYEQIKNGKIKSK